MNDIIGGIIAGNAASRAVKELEEAIERQYIQNEKLQRRIYWLTWATSILAVAQVSLAVLDFFYR